MSLLDDLERGIDSKKFSGEDRGVVRKSGSKDDVESMGRVKNRCRSCSVSVGVF